MESKSRRKSIFINFILAALLVTQAFGIYLYFMSSYRTDRTAHWFDQALQQSGWWVIYGYKDYSPSLKAEMPNFTPTFKWVERTLHSKGYAGILTRVSKVDEKYRLTVDGEDGEKSFDVSRVRINCDEGECENIDPRLITLNSNITIYLWQDLSSDTVIAYLYEKSE